MPRQYSRDFGERAIRAVTETRSAHDTEWSAIRQVATHLGVGPETVRKWVRQAEVNAALRLGPCESENAEIRRLKKKITELNRANEILQTTSFFRRRSLHRPAPI